MQPISARHSARSKALIVGAAVILLAGAFYYLLFRWHGDLLARHWLWFAEYRVTLSDPTSGTFPAFAHMLGWSLLAFGLLAKRNAVITTVVMLLMTATAEFTLGITDPADLLAALAGALSGVLVSIALLHRDVVRRRISDTVIAVALAGFSGLFISASCGSDCYGSSGVSPVYLSYTELRRSVAVVDARPLSAIKRLYLYDDYLFLNKRNAGIHILDNTDPRNPVNLAFIEIPGNTEISIRDNFLYADSYVDLVTLDLSDPDNIYEANRQIDIFPWDEYQNVSDDVYFDYTEIDQNRGVVVAYE